MPALIVTIGIFGLLLGDTFKYLAGKNFNRQYDLLNGVVFDRLSEHKVGYVEDERIRIFLEKDFSRRKLLNTRIL